MKIKLGTSGKTDKHREEADGAVYLVTIASYSRI
jgi:hypothetical protein